MGLILTAFDYFAFEVRPIPASTPLMGSLVALILMFAVRYVWRYLLERSLRPDAETATKALVFGAGDGGTQVVQSMIRDPYSIYLPVGILDDDPMLQNRRVSGVHVMGTRNDIETAASKTGATTLIIAIARADAALIRDVNAIASGAGWRSRWSRRSARSSTARSRSADIRDINEADLLGRHQIETDLDSIAHTLRGKRVLVTGAGGSIGSELCRQIYRYDPAELIMLDRDESALHAVQLAMHGRAMLDDDSTVLADIRDEARVMEVFERPATRGGFPRSGAQAPAAAGEVPGGGGQEQRVGHADRSARSSVHRRRHVRQHLDRQGSQPDQRAGLLQADC